MKNVLTEKEEEYLAKFGKLANGKGFHFIVLVIVSLLLVTLHLVLAFELKNHDPVQSRDQCWFAAMFGSWFILIMGSLWRDRKILKIIQKLKK